MRNIKFRVWDGQETMTDWKTLRQTAFNRGDNPLMYMAFVNPDWVLMQYTGLTDKNGVEIYEGDILQGRADYRYKVVWEVCEFICYHLDTGTRWGRLSRLNDSDMSDIFSNIEVIGNIYEEQK